MVKRYDLLKTLASIATDEMLVVTPIGNTSVFWDELGKGATFFFSLPALDSPQAIAPAIGSEPQSQEVTNG